MRYIVNNDMPYFRVLYKAYIIEEVGVGGWKMFTWNRNTQIKTQIDTAPVRNAVDILYRDMEKTLKPVSQWCGDILLEEDNSLGEEQYRIEVKTEQITIYAEDDLGWVYGLLLLSERFLGVKPFWFWMDQTFEQKESIEVVEQTIYSPKPVIRFRGWFFNDEVLMLKWKYNENWKHSCAVAATWQFRAQIRCPERTGSLPQTWDCGSHITMQNLWEQRCL